MSQKDLARRTLAQICFDGADITEDIRPYLISLTYTDSEEDEADDLQLKLQDRDEVWQQSWIKGAVDASASTKMEMVTKTVTESDDYTHKVNCNIGLNIRSGPGMGYGVVGVFAYGQKIRSTGKTSGSWTQVKYGSGKTGWSWTSYLTKISGKEAKAEAVTKTVTEETEVPGMKVQAVILRENWHGDGADDMLSCGQFELDSVQVDGPPDTITIKATALPFNATIRQTIKSRAWEAYSLSKIAQQMAQENGMACLYSAADDPYYERVEQSWISDIQFLSTLCHNAGISLKANNNILVLFDQAEYEAKPPVKTIRNRTADYTKKKLQTGKADKEYSSCRVRYTPPSGKLIEATAYVEDYEEDKDSNQQLEINAKVANASEAITLAKKMLRMRNKYEQTASFTLPGDTAMVSGVTVMLEDFGMFDGKYIVKEAKHSVSKSGYTTQIDLRKVLEGI